MKITYNTYEEYLSHHSSAHDSIIYWKKQLQCAQGKIILNVDGSPTHYTEEYAKDKMEECAYVLRAIEDSIHPDYDMDGNDIIVEGVECYSSIILKTLGSMTCPTEGRIIG